MFGRKQSSFTLGSRSAADHMDMASSEGGSELSPPPERRATPRPDPAAYFKDASEQLAAAGDPSLLKLGDAQSVYEAAPQSATTTTPKRRAGRAKTRLLGIDHGQPHVQVEDVLAGQDRQEASAPLTYHAVGWLVIMDGPGRGHSMPLRCGVSQLGRGDDEAVQLNFGDTSISRTNHASIAFDQEKRCFFIGHGGKANLVRLNDAPVLSTELLTHGDLIRIGETTLQLVAFCGDHFTWEDSVEAAPEEPVEAAEIVSEASVEASVEPTDEPTVEPSDKAPVLEAEITVSQGEEPKVAPVTASERDT